MIKYLKYLFIIILILSTSLIKLSDAKLNYKYVVTTVQFDGLKHLSEKRISDQLNLNSLVGQELNPKQVERYINQLYLLGFFEEVSVDSIIENKEHTLVFSVKETNILKHVSIRGNAAFTDKELRKIIKSKEGQLINLSHIETDKSRLEKHYHKNGYSLFKVLEMRLENKTLFIKVSEGYVDNIEFIGLKKIKPDILMRNLDMKKGAAFNTIKLRRDRERILKTGFFSDVTAPKLITSSDQETVNIIFTVKERKFNKVNLGLEQEQEQFVGFISGSRSHALIQSDLLSTKLQISNENESIGIKSYSIAYYQPWLFNKFNLSLNSFLWTKFTQDISANQATSTSKKIESTKRNGGSIKLGKPLIKDKLTVYAGYKDEKITPQDNNSSISSYQLQSLSSSLVYSSIYNRNNPNSGSYWSLEFERGGEMRFIKLDGLRYSKVLGSFAHFTRLSSKSLIGGRIQAGEFRPSERETYETESFIIGGTNSLRGYNEANYPFFGNKKIVFNSEYRYDINQRFQVVLFYDIGMASNYWITDIASYASGFGLGFRFQTPVGPIRTDFAKGKDDFMIHFGLGQLF